MLEFKRFRPLLLTVLLIALDQFTKALVVARIPLYSVKFSLGGDFFRMIHVRNLGMAFSLGGNWPELLRIIFFIILPLVVLAFLIVYLLKSKEVSEGQRWMLAGIVGGGIGNLIDRIFRPQGVVDFLDFKFYGIFGMERWPAFNVADASVLISGILLVISMLIMEVGQSKARKAHE